MNISEFVERSIGHWRSQRSAHHLAFRHFEAVESEIDIEPISVNDTAVIELCQSHHYDPSLAVSPFQMSWEGHSDWNEDEELKGSTILVPIPDREPGNQGKLLRSQGYAETMPAVGDYYFTEDNCFVLKTSYDRAAAEEKIWFGTEHLRFRVSMIKTSLGSGIVTASFSSEVRVSAP
ncbi:MAG: phycobiliprotein lyase [Coleofasciculaceae cyanobacterium RL_1_1]|nr:phycobiliprotein lyase [Coleofasciculaceae cyanobacterium RL_1_1]